MRAPCRLRWILCSSLLLSALAFYERGSNVHGLKSTNDFKRWVTNSSYLVMTEFYRETCGVCVIFEKEWEKAATDLKHIVHFVAIDVEKDPKLSNKVIQKYGISVTGVPTVVAFTPKSKSPLVYNGERKATAIKAWATSTMPDFVERLKPDAFDSWADYGKDPVRKVVLFSEKSSVAALMKAVSSEFKGRVQFGIATKSVFADLAKRYEVHSYPTLVVLRRPADDFEDDAWIRKHFGERLFTSLALSGGQKPTFRTLEGWVMSFASTPRSRKKKKAKPKKQEL